MKKTIVSAALALGAVCAIGAAVDSDPVLMTVNSKPVHRSEFEYLYHKNNSQQLQPQSLDEYVDMFVNYKLKVADAEEAGLDTTKDFRSEYEKFRNELAEPYLREEAAYDSLAREAYGHLGSLRYVRHIMLPLGETPEQIHAAEARIDSLRQAIIDGTADWDEVAAKYSVDGGSRNNGGIMGWMPAGRFPWPFEDMAYRTEVGTISPRVNSGFGYHIIRIDSVKPNPGEVHVEHILRLTQGMDSAATAQVALQVDSIRALLAAGADFADMAKRESQDPGSASRGGDLGWFGMGMMVKPFENAAFALKDGELSGPVKTAYGYHILHKLGSRSVAPFEDMRERLISQINSDDRALIPVQKKVARLTKLFDARYDEKGFRKLQKLIGTTYDSAAVERLKKSDIVLMRIGKTPVTVAEVMPSVPVSAAIPVADAVKVIRRSAERVMQERLFDRERDALVDTNPEYRNLIGEYRDGILLFARATDVVWDRASKEPEELEKFFRRNRDKYTWDQPKFKGYIVMAKNDSVLAEARAYTDSIGSAAAVSSDFVKDMRARFGRNIKVERVIAAKGDNAITDFLAFGGEKPADNPTGWNCYYAFMGRVVDRPEEAADVRGAVTTDFQNELEKKWVEALRAKYPVTIDRSVLSTVK